MTDRLVPIIVEGPASSGVYDYTPGRAVILPPGARVDLHVRPLGPGTQIRGLVVAVAPGSGFAPECDLILTDAVLNAEPLLPWDAPLAMFCGVGREVFERRTCDHTDILRLDVHNVSDKVGEFRIWPIASLGKAAADLATDLTIGRTIRGAAKALGVVRGGDGVVCSHTTFLHYLAAAVRRGAAWTATTGAPPTPADVDDLAAALFHELLGETTGPADPVH